jgi:guanyl-specific ribonuclease Sa
VHHGDASPKHARVNVRVSIAVAVSSLLIAGSAGQMARGQMPAAEASPMTAACGADKANFAIKKDAMHLAQAQPPEGQALVYLIEEMPGLPFVSSTVNFGVDGLWIGATKAETYIILPLTPGVHHLCTEYQTHLPTGEQGKITLRRLNLEAGKTYYILYRALIIKDSGEVAFLDQVDEDEGRYLVQTFDHVTSYPKK